MPQSSSQNQASGFTFTLKRCITLLESVLNTKTDNTKAAASLPVTAMKAGLNNSN